MKLLCLDVPKPGASLEKYQPHLLNEVRHTWQLYKSGVIRDIYFRQDRPGVAIIAEADSTLALPARMVARTIARPVTPLLNKREGGRLLAPVGFEQPCDRPRNHPGAGFVDFH